MASTPRPHRALDEIAVTKQCTWRQVRFVEDRVTWTDSKNSARDLMQRNRILLFTAIGEFHTGFTDRSYTPGDERTVAQHDSAAHDPRIHAEGPRSRQRPRVQGAK